MDKLQEDVKILETQEEIRGQDPLSQVLGIDLDVKEVRTPIEHIFSNSTLDISVGNINNVSPGTQVIMRPQISNAHLNLKDLNIHYTYSPGAPFEIPINQVALWRGTSIKLTPFNKTFSYGEIYAQQVLSQKGIAAVTPHMHGNWMSHFRDNAIFISPSSTTQVNYGGQLQTIVGQMQAGLAAAQPGNIVMGNAYQSLFNDYCVQKLANGDYNVSIWLGYFYPGLFESLEFHTLCMEPGQIEFQLTSVPQNECILQLLAGGAGATDYSLPMATPAAYVLSNFYLEYSHTKFDNTPDLLQQIQRNTYVVCPRYFLSDSYPVQQISKLEFTVGPWQKVHSLSVASHLVGSARGLAMPASYASTRAQNQTLFYNANHYLSGECILFPALKIAQIQINDTGRTLTLTPTNCACLQLNSAGQNPALFFPQVEGPNTQSHHESFLRSATTIDLTRYGGFFDEWGSGSSKTKVYTVNIQYDSTQDLSIYGIGTVGGNGQITKYPFTLPTSNGAFTGWQVYGFLGISSRVSVKNGQYYEIASS